MRPTLRSSLSENPICSPNHKVVWKMHLLRVVPAAQRLHLQSALPLSNVSPVVNQQPSASHALKIVVVDLTVHLTVLRAAAAIPSMLAAVKVM